MTDSLFTLADKTALVTGGNRGIGLGIALAMAEAGARVAVLGRDEERNADALAQLQAIVPDCLAAVADLADLDRIPEVYARAAEELGGIDILVNNAGVTIRGAAEQTPLPEFERVMKINLTAPFALAQCFARERIEKKQPGTVIMIGSLMCEAARPTVSAYTASKGGIRQLVRALAVDWAPRDIRVNGIGPGYIHTDMTQPLVDDPKMCGWVEGRTPLGRWGTPADIAPTAVFLASDAARFITGQILYVDGGWLATF
jgi:gluconate 5-dehydrogenase